MFYESPSAQDVYVRGQTICLDVNTCNLVEIIRDELFHKCDQTQQANAAAASVCASVTETVLRDLAWTRKRVEGEACVRYIQSQAFFFFVWFFCFDMVYAAPFQRVGLFVYR